MFQHLKIRANPLLEDIDLTELGRVNVVCGKNNSGKSTVLKLIAEAKCYDGFMSSDETVESIYNATVNARNWSPATQYDEEYRQTIQRVVAPPKVWFRDEAVAFHEACFAAHQESALRQYAMPDVVRAYNGLFSIGPPKVVLIPAKRSLDPIKTIKADQPAAEPGGQWVLGSLFFAKNQAVNSPERRILDNIQKGLEFVSDGYTHDITLSKDNRLHLSFSNQRLAQVDIPAEDCGLGLQDLLIILYFAFSAAEHEVVVLEEPENHLHPSMQRRLIHLLRDKTEKQYFLSTHANVFLDNLLTDKVFFTRFDGKISVDDATSRASMLDDPGYSVADNLVSDAIVLVEGPSDVPVLETLLFEMGLTARFDIKIWPLGGDIMDQVDLRVFQEKYRVTALIDRDPGSERVRERFKIACEEAGIPVCQLKRYSLENYFNVDALRAVFRGQIPDDLTEIDPDRKLEDQIEINVKRNNRKLAQATGLHHIQGTDLHDFLLSVEELCNT